MKTTIIKEAGYDEAILGLSLSKGATIERTKDVAIMLHDKDGGHNKFLESIYIWLDVTAPRFWWQEADTYRLSTKQSESTMHTILKQELTNANFDLPLSSYLLEELNRFINAYKEKGIPSLLIDIKNLLPEGFLQRRIWVMNYKCMRNIILQRSSHRLPQWRWFCKYILDHIEHPELLSNRTDLDSSL
jgi:hypothetical protein